ncbi:hypothetical protein BWI17_07075 [Betaproteobacteria bacterium GR16-43]|nr:hypothetical protein BWI17_07075 [Betaproteobacteria bacterium GR16-43]
MRGAILALSFAAAAQAQQPTDAAKAEMKAAQDAARAAMQEGPKDVKLGAQATLHLPKGYVFIPAAEATRMLKAMGNRPGNDTLGMIFPSDADAGQWMAVTRFISSGYIKDDDAKDWKADEMLDQIKEGTEASNAERRAKGFPEMQIVGWVEKPAYDAATHRLVWALESKDKNPTPDSERGVNYNTYLLGREGYISLNFVTDMGSIAKEKPIAKELLAALEFEGGKKYADFNASTDHIAEYGLAALVGGVAAKKLGLFALIAAFAVKFAKVIALGAFALGAAFLKFFKGKKEE